MCVKFDNVSRFCMDFMGIWLCRQLEEFMTKIVTCLCRLTYWQITVSSFFSSQWLFIVNVFLVSQFKTSSRNVFVWHDELRKTTCIKSNLDIFNYNIMALEDSQMPHLNENISVYRQNDWRIHTCPCLSYIPHLRQKHTSYEHRHQLYLWSPWSLLCISPLYYYSIAVITP